MKVKGEVVKTNEKNITLKDGSEKLKYFVTVKKHDNSLMTLSGWGKCPYEAGQVVEIEYDEDRVTNPDGSVSVYYNIKPPSKTEQAVDKVVTPKIEELIQVLAQPSLTVSIEKTIQEKQYEPKKIAVHLKVPIKHIDPQLIKNIINIVEAEVDERTGSWKSGKSDLTPEQQKKFEKAKEYVEKVMSKKEQEPEDEVSMIEKAFRESK